jgi:hypothetical protein
LTKQGGFAPLFIVLDICNEDRCTALQRSSQGIALAESTLY